MQHSLSTLRYRLVSGALRLEPLRILQSRRIAWADRDVTFYILGASHAVSLTTRDDALTELLTCAPPCEPIAPLAEARADVESDLCVQVGDLQCRVHLAPFALDAADDDLRHPFALEDRLAHCYPRHRAGGQPVAQMGWRLESDALRALRGADSQPVTRIGWRLEGDMLRIETIHTYPEEGRGVRTETLFRLASGDMA